MKRLHLETLDPFLMAREKVIEMWSSILHYSHGAFRWGPYLWILTLGRVWILLCGPLQLVCAASTADSGGAHQNSIISSSSNEVSEGSYQPLVLRRVRRTPQAQLPWCVCTGESWAVLIKPSPSAKAIPHSLAEGHLQNVRLGLVYLGFCIINNNNNNNNNHNNN